MPSVWVTGKVVRKTRHGLTVKLLQTSLSTVTVFLYRHNIRDTRQETGSLDTLFQLDSVLADRYNLQRRS
jgi:hypothetical protein